MEASDKTDGQVLANKPGIILKNDKFRLLIDVAIPSDKNLIKKETEKKIKYRNLSTEMQIMWDTKGFVTALIIRTTETVTEAPYMFECQAQLWPTTAPGRSLPGVIF
jgi:hypothetical protein